MGSLDLVRELQERAARGLPAEHVEHVDGWWLRHAPGCAWWVGTVLPHGAAAPGELARRVVRAEKFYAHHGVVARFQISPGACPDGLDRLLAEHGHRRGSAMSLQVERDNLAALRLYQRAGFGEICRYHYRPALTSGASASGTPRRAARAGSRPAG